MNAFECHDLINKYYADPILKLWEPSEYDMKYNFYTPRRAKKIPLVKAKEDAKIMDIYNKKVAQKKHVHDIIDEIATYPEEIQSLFYGTFSRTINYLVDCHTKTLDIKSKLEAEYGDQVMRVIDSFKYASKKTVHETSWSGRRMSRTYFIELDQDEWAKFAEGVKTNFHKLENGEYDYDYPAKSINDHQAFMKLAIQYFEAIDRDELHCYGADAYTMSIIHMSENLDNILKSIKMYFNGSKPTACLTDATWGYKGEFCGVLTDGVKKISFKSFSAGGHNIQKYHFRFKCTELKH